MLCVRVLFHFIFFCPPLPLCCLFRAVCCYLRNCHTAEKNECNSASYRKRTGSAREECAILLLTTGYLFFSFVRSSTCPCPSFSLRIEQYFFFVLSLSPSLECTEFLVDVVSLLYSFSTLFSLHRFIGSNYSWRRQVDRIH